MFADCGNAETDAVDANPLRTPTKDSPITRAINSVRNSDVASPARFFVMVVRICWIIDRCSDWVKYAGKRG